MSDIRIKPLLVVKPGTISRRDIARAEKSASVLVIECADPESARFMLPPPESTIGDQAGAALSLMRMVLSTSEPTFTRGTLTKFFCDALLRNDKPKPVPPVQP